MILKNYIYMDEQALRDLHEGIVKGGISISYEMFLKELDKNKLNNKVMAELRDDDPSTYAAVIQSMVQGAILFNKRNEDNG